MPIYEYQCESCGQRTEVMQRLSEPPLETCDACDGKLRKLISAPAFQFKGSGWYVTDYARKGGGESGGDKESKTDSKEGSTPDKGSDSKSGESGSSSTSSSTETSESKKDSKKGSGD